MCQCGQLELYRSGNGKATRRVTSEATRQLLSHYYQSQSSGPVQVGVWHCDSDGSLSFRCDQSRGRRDKTGIDISVCRQRLSALRKYAAHGRH